MTAYDVALGRVQELDLEQLLGMEPDELTALRDDLLARQVELVFEGHPYYRELMARNRLVPADIRSIDDLQKLPVTTKRDFLGDPDAFRLSGPELPVEMRTLWEIVYTTGTSTGVPAPIYTTTFDFLTYGHTAYRRRAFTPMNSSDVVVNLFPQTPYPGGAYLRTGCEVAAYGAATVVARTGRTPAYFGTHRSLEAAAELVVTHRATVLYGIAGFVRRLLVHAQRTGLDFSSVRMVMVSGEASSHGVLEDMRQRLLMLGSSEALVVNRYGSTEQGSSMVECEPGSGFHNLSPDQVYLETVDESGARLPSGARGSLAFTHLLRRGTILLRYLPGDVASIDRDPCPYCGRTASERMSPDVRRAGGIQKIKGSLVDVESIVSRLAQIKELEEFQIALRATDPTWPEAVDELVVRVAIDDADLAAGVAEVAQIVEEVGHVRPRIERCTAVQIFDPEEAVKPRRIVFENAQGHPVPQSAGV